MVDSAKLRQTAQCFQYANIKSKFPGKEYSIYIFSPFCLKASWPHSSTEDEKYILSGTFIQGNGVYGLTKMINLSGTSSMNIRLTTRLVFSFMQPVFTEPSTT